MRVTLIGDSIRIGYQPHITRELSGQAEGWGPDQNGGASANGMADLDNWVLDRRADVVHVNSGLHDLKLPEGEYQVPLEQYVHNLHEMIDRVRGEFDGQMIWATTTPVMDERHQAVKHFERHEEDVRRYNEAALAVMESHGVSINDLHETVMEAGVARLLTDDGVHFTDEGYRILANAVADRILTAVG